MKCFQTSYAGVADHKGSKRIWLESKRLASIGFNPGEAYSTILNLNDNTLTLYIDLFGQKRVVERKRKLKNGSSSIPVIDLCNSDVVDLVGDFSRVRVDYFPERIVISLHHEDVAEKSRVERTRRNLQEGKISTGTLCAGAGISTAAIHDGLASAGVKSSCSWLIDNEPQYLAIADRNNHAVSDDTRLFVASLEEVETNLLSPVDLLNVSLPCNIHASCGKAKKGLKAAEDDQSITSVFGLMNIVRAVQPTFIVSENVVEAQSSQSYAMIRAELKRSGYEISERVISGNEFGALENRVRYWFVATSKSMSNINLDDLTKRDGPFKTIGDVLEDNQEFRTFDYLDEKEKRDIANGKNFRQVFVTPECNSVGTIPKGYARIRSTDPKLRGDAGTGRLFTVTEASKLRLIPTHLLDDCASTIGHEAGGQSISYPHGTSIGELIGSTLLAA